MRFRWPAALALAVLVATPPIAANHNQVSHGDVIVFDHKTGNEWWVEVLLQGGASGSVATVEAMDTGGTWVAMAHHPEWQYNDWAASFHIEPGHQVKFRATWTGGEQVESCWFEHPSGTERCAPFDATFSQVKGNEWWAEAVITANAPIDGVFLTLNCDTSRDPADMVYKPDWGKWVLGGTRIPSGSVVTMTAYGGASHDESGGYVWPQATPVPGCAGGFAAQYSNVRGNEWWVESTVEANAPIAGVNARSDGGSWVKLAKQSYGDWAGSFHIRLGSYVEFQAVSASGATSQSGQYAWPSHRPVQPWPQEGSYVSYTLHSHQFIEGTGTTETDAFLDYTYQNGDWTGACRGVTTNRAFDGTVTSTASWTATAHLGPISLSTRPRAGDTTNAKLLIADASESCERREQIIRVVGQADFQTAMTGPDGRPQVLFVWYANEADSDTQDTFVTWDRQEGLILDWSHDPFTTASSQFRGRLWNTDAPIR